MTVVEEIALTAAIPFARHVALVVTSTFAGAHPRVAEVDFFGQLSPVAGDAANLTCDPGYHLFSKDWIHQIYPTCDDGTCSTIVCSSATCAFAQEYTCKQRGCHGLASSNTSDGLEPVDFRRVGGSRLDPRLDGQLAENETMVVICPLGYLFATPSQGSLTSSSSTTTSAATTSTSTTRSPTTSRITTTTTPAPTSSSSTPPPKDAAGSTFYSRGQCSMLDREGNCTCSTDGAASCSVSDSSSHTDVNTTSTCECLIRAPTSNATAPMISSSSSSTPVPTTSSSTTQAPTTSSSTTAAPTTTPAPVTYARAEPWNGTVQCQQGCNISQFACRRVSCGDFVLPIDSTGVRGADTYQNVVPHVLFGESITVSCDMNYSIVSTSSYEDCHASFRVHCDHTGMFVSGDVPSPVLQPTRIRCVASKKRMFCHSCFKLLGGGWQPRLALEAAGLLGRRQPDPPLSQAYYDDPPEERWRGARCPFETDVTSSPCVRVTCRPLLLEDIPEHVAVSCRRSTRLSCPLLV
jgi:hypothetical protein